MRFRILILFLVFFSAHVWATHNRAGEITYKQTGPNTIEICVVTYTKESSTADRPEITIDWGDGTSDIIQRAVGYPILFDSDINKNKYVATHVYPGQGEFTISFEDPNRNADVVNIPNSVQVPFYIESIVNINPFLGTNDSPELLNPPINDACLGKLYLHNPGAFDADGDSLVYTLVESKGLNGLPIPGYSFPPNVTLDSETGDLVWDTPPGLGEYNFAILVQEYRNGFLIGSVLRDMQVTVLACPDNDPPVITVPDRICVVVGDSVDIPVIAQDPNLGDSVTLIGISGAFSSISSPFAVFNQPVKGVDSVGENLTWKPTCDHIRKASYNFLWKANDNGNPVNLLDLKTTEIYVLAPAPNVISATPSGNTIDLIWNTSFCINAIAYKIYRKEGPSSFVQDTCETGMPSGVGYQLIGTNNSLSDTTFIDDDNGSGLVLGKTYCYRIVACFPDGSESKVSDEVCAELAKTIPAIINVSVNNTDVTNGSIFVRWVQPSDLDQIQHPGPYSYKVYRSVIGQTGSTQIGNFTSLTDTSIVDTLINTVDDQFEYIVELWNETVGDTYLIGTSASASSVYLNIAAFDEKLILSWKHTTPWVNDTFVVYRESFAGSGVFNILDTTYTVSYIDKGLINGETYCYQILTIGAYSGSGYPAPLLNYSQENCGIPKDTVPPCAPLVSIDKDCETGENIIRWSPINDTCDVDLLNYKLYYKPSLTDPYSVLQTFQVGGDTSFVHSNLEYVAGCYLVTATDSTGNESELLGESCVDNCPVYTLPNVFTPQGDGNNDYFIPFPYRHIEKIDLKIYNRWGTIVFQTEDPDILWNGRNKDTNLPSADGTYYYVCDVHQRKLAGTEIVQLKGYIQLIGDGFNAESP